ncbi:exosortase/archaeosortase family protein [Cyanobium sp. ATX 6A2]|uniref:archaeosortase/exosortase family protein n=1 Tax=Cyanobium sp. ATX 6A2 TaxID=2823700 RepID=UPI0020CC8958|nr:archaeosortase/exosortase family protein [Cyanobium sp. ATX 6A2]MCP9888947.1 exosortase/archaeosortase family protein [Cyanobium sp. ATX 6A2]
MSGSSIHSSAAWARLTLLMAVASAQLTLATRGGQGAFVIMAALPWLGGAVLLLEREQEPSAAPAADAGPLATGLALVLLLWSLLVLSFAARLYDPLLAFIPLAVLPALALLSGLAPRQPLVRELAAIGALLPAQVLINVLLPVEPLARLTAQISALLLWMLGRPAFAEGNRIVLPDQILLVDASCTGRTTLAFCLATAALLLVLLPLPALVSARRRRQRSLLLGLFAVGALLGVVLLNGVRITLLAFTSQQTPAGLLDTLGSFAFWHDGHGAQLFSLLASAIVCAGYVGVQEALRQQHPTS